MKGEVIQIVYHVQNLFNEMGITGFMTFSATMLGAVSLMLSNFARHVQANKFGIPIKIVHQANVGDSFGMWITLVSALGFGFFVPFLLLGAETAWWVIYLVMAVSSFLCLSFSKIYVIQGKPKETKYNGDVYTHKTDWTWMVHAILSLILALAFLRLRNMYQHVYIAGYETAFAEGFFARLWLFLAFFVTGVYVLVALASLSSNVMDKLFGGIEKMVTEIDGQTYLVAMRSSQYHWILIPCDFTENTYKSKIFRRMEIITCYARFEKNKFILCDMSKPPMEIRRLTGYKLVEKGVLKGDSP